jgi:hypothetical protein
MSLSFFNATNTHLSQIDENEADKRLYQISFINITSESMTYLPFGLKHTNNISFSLSPPQ